MSLPISIDQPTLEAFCEQHHIRKLALFGSVLTNVFSPESDIDVLVEFEPGVPVGFFKFIEVQDALSEFFGRPVDLNTPGFLSRHFRQQVMDTAKVIYERQGQDASV